MMRDPLGGAHAGACCRRDSDSGWQMDHTPSGLTRETAGQRRPERLGWTDLSRASSEGVTHVPDRRRGAGTVETKPRKPGIGQVYDRSKPVVECWVPEPVEDGNAERLRRRGRLLAGLAALQSRVTQAVVFVFLGLMLVACCLAVFYPVMGLGAACVLGSVAAGVLILLGVDLGQFEEKRLVEQGAIVTVDVRFELTCDSVRVCMGAHCRELLFTEVSTVNVLPMASDGGIGHIVV